jgi:hypothetical protein
MKQITLNVFTEDELNEKVKQLCKENWTVNNLIRDCHGGNINGVIPKWHPNTKDQFLQMLGIKEVPTLYVAIDDQI